MQIKCLFTCLFRLPNFYLSLVGHPYICVPKNVRSFKRISVATVMTTTVPAAKICFFSLDRVSENLSTQFLRLLSQHLHRLFECKNGPLIQFQMNKFAIKLEFHPDLVWPNWIGENYINVFMYSCDMHMIWHDMVWYVLCMRCKYMHICICIALYYIVSRVSDGTTEWVHSRSFYDEI